MYFCTSSCVILPLGPLPEILDTSAPNSLANLLTEGLACARPALTSSPLEASVCATGFAGATSCSFITSTFFSTAFSGSTF